MPPKWPPLAHVSVDTDEQEDLGLFCIFSAERFEEFPAGKWKKNTLVTVHNHVFQISQ